MDYIQVKNLRSLYDTEGIEIKKLNILVGNNSSGKSTFLRIFPLLKQSFNKRINGPILWAGDEDDYVDFGSFREALSNGSKEDTIRFKFRFDCSFDTRMSFLNRRRNTTIKGRDYGTVVIEFAISHNNQSIYDGYVSELLLEYRDYKIIIKFSVKYQILELTINGEKVDIIKDESDYFGLMYESGIFDISLASLRKTARKHFFELLGNEDEVGIILEYFYFTRMCMNKINLDDLEESDRIEEILRNVEEQESKLKNLVFLYNLPRYYAIISQYLREYFNNVYYIAPVRATAERYYRLRNAAVNEVDCRGKNLPVFLNSLKNEQFNSFRKWTQKNLGFEVEKSLSEGHVSLKIKKEGQDKAVNLSDTGFGYSQILPIVTQLWYITEVGDKRRNTNIFKDGISEIKIPITIAIEQPELHLHPALQAKLMDIIAKIAMEKNVRFIIETHSETIINRIGLLIDKKKVNNKDIGVTIFDKKFGDDKTQVKKSTFDEEGYLKEWPIGFFEPEED